MVIHCVAESLYWRRTKETDGTNELNNKDENTNLRTLDVTRLVAATPHVYRSHFETRHNRYTAEKLIIFQFLFLDVFQ